MAVHGSSWQSVGVHGSPWQPIAVHDSPWKFIAAQGSSWQSMAVHGSSCQCEAVCRCAGGWGVTVPVVAEDWRLQAVAALMTVAWLATPDSHPPSTRSDRSQSTVTMGWRGAAPHRRQFVQYHVTHTCPHWPHSPLTGLSNDDKLL